MTGNRKIIQSVPNFSEGRDLHKVELIVDAFRAKEGLKLLDYSTDYDHNRCVITVIGEPDAMHKAMVEAVGISIDLIDMNRHEGKHPRIGCADVIPFIPLRNTTIEDADVLAKTVASEIAEKFGQPVFLYEESASAPHREDIAKIREGQFEGLAEKMKDPLWFPDYGPPAPHPTGGATVVGARAPLIYFNVNLSTSNVEIARKIARRIRNVDGGLRYVKAMGYYPEGGSCAQVTMNMTDYSKNALYTAYEMVKMEARRYGVTATGTEIVGFVPMDALVSSAEYYLQLEDFSSDQILEMHI